MTFFFVFIFQKSKFKQQNLAQTTKFKQQNSNNKIIYAIKQFKQQNLAQNSNNNIF